VRFAVADLADPASVDLAGGLLREAGCDLIVADARATEITGATWDLLRRLLVPGGLALIRGASQAPEGGQAPGGGWRRLRAGEQEALWAAPPDLPDGAPGELDEPRWVITGPGHLGDSWAWWMAPQATRVARESLDAPWLWSEPVQEQMRGLRAIDFFGDDPGSGDDPGDDPAGTRLVTRFLELIRALIAAREGGDDPCRVTVVTSRSALDVRAPRAAALWGAVRALGHEVDSALDLRLADVGAAADLTTLRWLARHDVREREVAIRDGLLYAPRLVTPPGQGEATAPAAEVTAPTKFAGDARYQLQLAAAGQISGLAMRSVPAAQPGPHEVEIAVGAAALNFRDIMVTLDMLPMASYERSALGREVGIEASGTVTRIGAAVTSVRPGDPVIFMAGGCVASSVTVPEKAVFAKPAALSMPQAAAALSVYVTAYYALSDLARLRPGQRVLIHSAMGGVGQAAIALARRAGAVVYATAGTAAKRDKLRELGVGGAFDSHSFSWYDDLMAATGGEGVDVVLNSLAGHHITLCLEALRPGGWHCEIGKVDIYADAALGLSVFRKNLRFAAIDIDRLMHDDPDRARELTLDCLRLLEDGAVPPPPVTTYGYERYADALRFMASGQHEGKIVLLAPDDAAARRLRVTDRRPFLDPEATYLVTGGFGGLGVHLVAYLAAAGARHLTLLDRDPAGRRDAEWLRHAANISYFMPDTDITLDIARGDVSRPEDVTRVVSGLTRPLKGVFHLAAVLDDHQLADVTPQSVAAVFGPKAGGAWNLHRATGGLALDHFVLLSSIASVIGNAGQSVYAAANAYLDGLAAYRQGRGLPALAFNMAGLAEAGMAARQPHLLRVMRAAGMPPVSVAVAIASLDAALRGTVASGTVASGTVASGTVASGTVTGGAAAGDASHVICADIGRLPGGASHPDFMRASRWMGDDGQPGGFAGQELTAEAISADICATIGRLSGHEQVGPQETIASFGVNSVSIAELSAVIRSRFGHHVGILDLMTTATPESIAHAIISGKATLGPGADDAGRPFEAASAATTADATLPAQCQEDLARLQHIVRDLAAARPAGPAVAPGRFAAVFLTGATGFVGRFVLAELLRRCPGLVVHCLVRAESPARGRDRIRAGMTAAEIWDDAFAERITVWTGDVGEPLLGLAEEDFTRLAGEVDAVYHLAADLNLISSYPALRETNTRSLAGVLELALTKRVKHVIYASTMGVFPQYFGNFAGELAGMRIEDEAMPDIALMRSVMPPGLIGYPWSKLVAEQGLLFARALGVPVAIMRLPQTGIAASTGFTQSTDIKVRVVSAVLDTGLAPAGFTTMWTEPVDTVSETLVRLSLSPRRQHVTYHLVNPRPATHGLALGDFGLPVREVSYQEFKRACQARGARGPLHGHWPLIDHFARLWFPAPGEAGGRESQERPVSVASVTADLGTAGLGTAGLKARGPDWPGLITTTARSLSWIGRHPGEWPYQRPAVPVDAASLHRQARELAARLDVGFDDAYPPELLDGLDQLVAALRAPAARIRDDRWPAIGFELRRRLWNRASLAAERARHPEIARERVERPVFILGINRTGTTLLHRLLARGTRFWAPYPDEVAHPSLPAGGQPGARRGYAEDLLAATGVAEALRGIHAVDIGEPEEEFAFLEESFAAWTYPLRFAIPRYARWLAARDAGFAYGVHRQAMRHLSWQRGTRLGEAPRPWLLKMPFHLAEPRALVAAYPDAVFIQTHRSPREFLPSWLSLAESARSLSAHPLDAAGKAALGAEQLAFMSRMLEGVARLRSTHADFDRRFIDVSYQELVADPVQTAADIYQHAGWTFDEQSRARMERWHAGQAARRRAERRHQYALPDFGLTEDQVEGAFGGYAEFTRANKIRMR
jgi:thioester reductase-like protein